MIWTTVLRHPLGIGLTATVVLFASVVAWYHWITVPRLQAQVSSAQSLQRVAEAKNAVDEANIAELEQEISAQNAAVESFRADCTQREQAAEAAAQKAAKVKTPHVAHNAQELMKWLDSLRSQ